MVNFFNEPMVLWFNNRLFQPKDSSSHHDGHHEAKNDYSWGEQDRSSKIPRPSVTYGTIPRDRRITRPLNVLLIIQMLNQLRLEPSFLSTPRDVALHWKNSLNRPWNASFAQLAWPRMTDLLADMLTCHSRVATLPTRIEKQVRIVIHDPIIIISLAPFGHEILVSQR